MNILNKTVSLPKVGRLVDTEYVDLMRTEYKKERWVQNSERIGKPDSLSAWSDLASFEDFTNACKEHGADGVRFYFATYPQDWAATPEYAGRQSIVVVATKSRVDENGNITNKDLYINRNGRNVILGQNNFPLCPPRCGSFGDSDLGLYIVDKGGNEGLEII